MILCKMHTFLTLALCTQLIPVSLGEGVFQLGLLSLTNELGRDLNSRCCSGIENPDGSCSGSGCSTYFRICLKQFQTNIDTDSSCTYGQFETPVLGRNSIDLQSHADLKEPLHFEFSFAWPGTFTLIVEAWHNTTNELDSDESAPSSGLILRIAEAKRVLVGEDWTAETHTSGAHSGAAGLKLRYRVVCAENYFGKNCVKFCKPRNTKFGHFECTNDGTKRCLSGWQGKFCDKAVCAPGCHAEHGECHKPGACHCKVGWIGPNCDQCQRYPGCLKGTCSKPWECLCEEGWGGIFCNQDLNFCTHHRPCQNGATCTNSGEGHYTCTCEPGYSGTNCERKIQDCSLQPCLNGGVCKEESSNYTCNCPAGYSGRHCQISASTCEEDPCRNGASCIDQPHGYTCLCLKGWQGTNCDTEKNECDSDPCLNDGRCIDDVDGFQCICPVGFDGPTCEINIDDCRHNPCLNRGRCKDQVNAFKCECAAGFTGTLCQHNIDDCLRRPCANGGTCFDLTDDFKCVCRPGFRGQDCSIDVNECASSPCRNGGLCTDLVDAYSCDCPQCYSGPNCGRKDRLCLSALPATGHGAEPQPQQAPWISIGLPILIVLLLGVMLLLFLVVICLYRRFMTRRKQLERDPEYQNDCNKTRETTKYYQNNLSLVNTTPVAFVHPYTVQKVDNNERVQKNAQKKLCPEENSNTDRPSLLTPIDINTFTPELDAKLCKSASVEKLHQHQRDRRRSQMLPQTASRDSGLGSPVSGDYGPLSPPLETRDGGEGRTCVALRVALAPPPSQALNSASALTKQHHSHVRNYHHNQHRPTNSKSTVIFDSFDTQV